jgi:hypothetical protein
LRIDFLKKSTIFICMLCLISPPSQVLDALGRRKDLISCRLEDPENSMSNHEARGSATQAKRRATLLASAYRRGRDYGPVYYVRGTVQAATNVVLAQHLLPHLDQQHKKWIIAHIIQQLKLEFGQTAEQAMRDLNQQGRIPQLSIVAFASDFLEIYPRINLGHGCCWIQIRRMNSIGNIYAL